MAAIDQPRKNLEPEHHPERIRRRLRAEGGGYLGDAVLGGIDGAITSFAVVAGAVGGGLSGNVVLVLGFASLLADGFSMAVSNYLGTRSEAEVAQQAQREEERHIDEVPHGQREELRQIFVDKGFEGQVLEEVVDTIAEDRELWAQTVVREEFNLEPVGDERPVRAGAATFGAFLVAGCIPLLPFLLRALDDRSAFYLSVACAAVVFFCIGVLKGRALHKSKLKGGIETLLIGGGAAVLAYIVGNAVRSLIDGGAMH